MPSRKRKAPGSKKAAQDGPVELFPSDDEKEDLEVEKQPQPKKVRKEKEPVEEVPEMDDFNDDGVDIVKAIYLADW